MSDVITLETPNAAALCRFREELGLSQSELASELGFGVQGPGVVRAWEEGFRFGKPFGPTPLAWRCFRLMVVCFRSLSMPAHEAKPYIRANLSEKIA